MTERQGSDVKSRRYHRILFTLVDSLAGELDAFAGQVVGAVVTVGTILVVGGAGQAAAAVPLAAAGVVVGGGIVAGGTRVP